MNENERALFKAYDAANEKYFTVSDYIELYKIHWAIGKIAEIEDTVNLVSDMTGVPVYKVKGFNFAVENSYSSDVISMVLEEMYVEPVPEKHIKLLERMKVPDDIEVREIVCTSDSDKTTSYNRCAYFICNNVPDEYRYEVAAAVEADNCPDFFGFFHFYNMMHWPDEIAKKNETKKHSGSIYIIQCEQTGRIKIGHTVRSIETRLNEIRGMSSGTLKVILHFKAPREAELELHKYLEKHRVHGEWFSEDISNHIINRLKNGIEAKLNYKELLELI